MIDNGFTPTQRKIMDVLADGKPHTRQEIKECLPDELSPIRAIQNHLSNMRKVLRPKGFDIVCTLSQRRICYQYVRLVSPF